MPLSISAHQPINQLDSASLGTEQRVPRVPRFPGPEIPSEPGQANDRKSG
jgi:hypothetical protein